jgi:predicted glutamine amidotransferase
MCGISGFLTVGEHSEFAKEKFIKILLASQVRGRDATGFAFVKDRDILFYKEPVDASVFVKTKVFKTLLKENNPTLVIGHNRAKTQGGAENNKNNHPVVSKLGLALVHNGVISNDREVKEEFNLKTDGEVDTEVILRLVEHFIFKKNFKTINAIKASAKKLRGSMAIALLRVDEPGNVYLLSSGNPICLAYHRPTGTIFWASTRAILEEALFDYKFYFHNLFFSQINKKDFVFKEMEENTGLKLSLGGWVGFEVERPSYYVYRWQNWDEEKTFNVGKTKVEPVLPQKPIVVEKKENDKFVVETLKKQLVDFDETSPIKKPGGYLSELLLMRLESIQDQILFENDSITPKEIERLQMEVRRILDALKFRKSLTGREIYIPTQDEIFKGLGSENFTDAVLDQGFDWDWVLSKKNKDLFENILKAQDELEREGLLEYEPKDAQTKTSTFWD